MTELEDREVVSPDLAVTVPVRTILGRLEIGPPIVPGAPGCESCLEIRARRTNRARRLVGEERARSMGGPLVTSAARTVAKVLADRVRATEITSGGRVVFHLDLTTLEVSRHVLLPDPLCPQCGDVPEDDARSVGIDRSVARPKVGDGDLRVRNVLSDLAELEELYVDDQMGLIREITTGHQGGLTVAAAMMPIRVRAIIEPGVGRTRSYATSRLVAMLEALERWGGVAPTDKRVAIDASYEDLQDRAIDPMSLGGHEAELMGTDSTFAAYAPSTPCTWVWGYSFTEERPVLVPEYVAYYYAHFDAPRKPFLFEISNGCALGSCLEEAIVHGILETIERDAFLLTWYAELPLREIDLTTAGDHAVRLQSAAIEQASGYRVRCFDSTMEHGVPSVWVMAEAPEGSDGPALVCSAGAHPDQERAALSGLSELGPLLWDLQRRFPEQREESAAMFADSAVVRSMHDHSILYGHPGAAERLDFLGGNPRVPFRARLETAGDPTDLRSDLADVLDRLAAVGLGVVVVDQTTDEHRAGGLHCVKVLVPGMLPMTFGHRNRRITGLRRLWEVPVARGFRAPGEAWAVNPYPHPFP